MNEGKKSTVIITLLVVVIVALVVQSVVMGGRISELETQVSMLHSEVVNAPNQLYGQLTGYVEETLRESKNFVESYGLIYTGVDEASKTVKARLTFRLKETMKGSQIKVLAVPLNAAAVPGDEYDASTSNDLDYVSEFPLSWLRDFELNIYQKDASDNTRKLNAESIAACVQTEYQNRTMPILYSARLGEEGVYATASLENRTFGSKDYRIKKAEFVLLVSGLEAARMDITEKSLVESEDIEKYTLEASAGDTNLSDNLASAATGKVQIDSLGVERGYYVISIGKDQIKLTPRMEASTQEYTYTVEVTYENGEVYKSKAAALW